MHCPQRIWIYSINFLHLNAVIIRMCGHKFKNEDLWSRMPMWSFGFLISSKSDVIKSVGFGSSIIQRQITHSTRKSRAYFLKFYSFGFSFSAFSGSASFFVFRFNGLWTCLMRLLVDNKMYWNGAHEKPLAHKMHVGADICVTAVASIT